MSTPLSTPHPHTPAPGDDDDDGIGSFQDDNALEDGS